MPGYVPYVVEKTVGGERSVDIYSRLLRDRIVMLDGEVNEQSASIIVSELLFLASEDPEKDIHLYINSPGGMVTAGLAIYDTMNLISCDVCTYAMGMAASMGAFLLSGGAKGKRYALPNAEIMIHQPSGGSRGQATEIEIAAENILKTKRKLTQIIADNCGQTYNKVYRDMERDHYLDSEQAYVYGLVDSIQGKTNAELLTIIENAEKDKAEKKNVSPLRIKDKETLAKTV